MSLVKWTFIALLLLPAAEIVAFLLVAMLTGWLSAATLLIATSLFGLALLRRSARGDFSRLRAALARDGPRAMHLNTPGAAPLLGGILLLFPGFITDIIGVGLLVPPLRRWASGKFAGAVAAQRDDRIIDLEPGEWHRIPHRRRRQRRSGQE